MRDESSARLKRIVLSFDPMIQVSLPVPSTEQVILMSSPEHAALPAVISEGRGAKNYIATFLHSC